ncbi:unnamed protein product [Sphagnum jensenii]|uniref:Bifunctional inhibitor/plant lipid transfer protein/seed storage helical domain-containing protein n=1 Tax=Sphagnum jensenii TaxID=128206 RepID=A0ABP1AUK8_9BRYO
MGYRSQAAMSEVMVQLLLPLLLLLLLPALNVAAQTASSSDCTQYVTDLGSCQNYLINAATVPGTDCCSGIATVEKDSVSCLCAIVNQLVGGASSGVNLTRVYAIPKDCNLTFSNSSCLAAGVSPTASTPTSTGASPSPVGGVAAAPSKNGGAKSIIVPSFYTVFGAVVLGCVPSMVFSVVAGFGLITAV